MVISIERTVQRKRGDSVYRVTGIYPDPRTLTASKVIGLRKELDDSGIFYDYGVREELDRIEEERKVAKVTNKAILEMMVAELYWGECQ